MIKFYCQYTLEIDSSNIPYKEADVRPKLHLRSARSGLGSRCDTMSRS